MAASLRGHKQRKLNGHVYSFLLFVSSTPHYQAEFNTSKVVYYARLIYGFPDNVSYSFKYLCQRLTYVFAQKKFSKDITRADTSWTVLHSVQVQLLSKNDWNQSFFIQVVMNSTIPRYSLIVHRLPVYIKTRHWAFDEVLLQSNQVNRAPQDYIWIDYLNIKPASHFKNAIMNWLLESWTH